MRQAQFPGAARRSVAVDGWLQTQYPSRAIGPAPAPPARAAAPKARTGAVRLYVSTDRRPPRGRP